MKLPRPTNYLLHRGRVRNGHALFVGSFEDHFSTHCAYIKSSGRTTLHVKLVRICKEVVVFNQRVLLQILFVRTEEITKTLVTIFSR